MSKMQSYLERNARYLLSPLTSLSHLKVSDDHLMLFAESQLHVSDNFCALIEAVRGASCSLTVLFYFPERREFHSEVLSSCEDLRTLYRDPDFLSDFFMASRDGDVLLYHSARDDFAVVAVDDTLVSADTVRSWDSEFANHIGSTGIGFGKAGELYAQELLSELPLDRRRKFKIRRRAR